MNKGGHFSSDRKVMTRYPSIVRIQVIILLAVCLVACSGFARLRVTAFEPANAEQAAYEWSRKDNMAMIHAPSYRLMLRVGSFSWTGSARSGGTIGLQVSIEDSAPRTGAMHVANAYITPIRVTKNPNVELVEEYPFVPAESFEYRRPSERGVAPLEPVEIDTHEADLLTWVPFRPRRVHLTLVLENTHTNEQETFTFVVRDSSYRSLF